MKPGRKIILEGSTNAKAYVDKERIVQVMMNLLMNAVKFSPETQPVHVTVLRRNNDVIISVQDSGDGIRKSDQKNIFDAYSTVHGKISKQGLGMALFICKEIIKLHGGKIWLESKLGKGSIFYFSLPSM